MKTEQIQQALADITAESDSIDDLIAAPNS